MRYSPSSVSANTSTSLGFLATKHGLPGHNSLVKRDISKTPYEIMKVVRL